MRIFALVVLLLSPVELGARVNDVVRGSTGFSVAEHRAVDRLPAVGVTAGEEPS